jgi:hypothetical protein
VQSAAVVRIGGGRQFVVATVGENLRLRTKPYENLIQNEMARFRVISAIVKIFFSTFCKE